MFSYIIGNVTQVRDANLVIENNGIGYDLTVSTTTLAKMGTIGREAQIFTYLQVNDDGLNLYGFYSMAEKDMFLKLITISGVGPKLAIAVLSGIELERLGYSIVAEDVKALSSIKGVGKKTAERIVLELKEKVDVGGLNKDGAAADNSGEINDAIAALASLGYSRAEAVKAVTKASETCKTTEEMISFSLKSMNRF